MATGYLDSLFSGVFFQVSFVHFFLFYCYHFLLIYGSCLYILDISFMIKMYFPNPALSFYFLHAHFDEQNIDRRISISFIFTSYVLLKIS